MNEIRKENKVANWHLIDYKGKLAVTLGWYPDKDTPTESRPVWVGDIPYDQRDWSIYHSVKLIHNGLIQMWRKDSYTPTWLEIDGWEHFDETRPIKKPGRGGKDWDWVWSSWGRKWVKEWK